VKHIKWRWRLYYSTGFIYNCHLRSSKYFYNTGHRSQFFLIFLVVRRSFKFLSSWNGLDQKQSNVFFNWSKFINTFGQMFLVAVQAHPPPKITFVSIRKIEKKLVKSLFQKHKNARKCSTDSFWQQRVVHMWDSLFSLVLWTKYRILLSIVHTFLHWKWCWNILCALYMECSWERV